MRKTQAGKSLKQTDPALSLPSLGHIYWLTLAISKRQRRKALSLTAYTAVKSSKTEKNFVREYKTAKGTLSYDDYGNDYSTDEGVLEMACTDYPMSEEEYDDLLEKECRETRRDIDRRLTAIIRKW